jgi:hypothetical protein
MALFQGSVFGYKQWAEQSAAQEVRDVSRHIATSPAFGAALDEIAAKYTLDVAVLDPNGKKGTRRDVQHSRDDFFGQKIVTSQYIDIRVPFSGNPESFDFAPSRCTLLDRVVDVQQMSIFFTVADGANVQREVDGVISNISQTLETLRSEIEAWRPQLRRVIQQIADQRLASIQQTTNRDKNLDFPVD